MSKAKPIKSTKQARAAFIDLIAALDLKNVDGGAIFDAVLARGFEREARTFSISLATVVLAGSGLSIDETIDAAVEILVLNARLAEAIKQAGDS